MSADSRAYPNSGDTEAAPRYCIGIDLGTTNCVVAYVDTQADVANADPPLNVGSAQPFAVPQWVDLSVAESRLQLPSFHYTLTQDEAATVRGQTDEAGGIPAWLWMSGNQQDSDPGKGAAVCVGEAARVSGQARMGRCVVSAKSWLSHPGVDRSADLLPWHGEADVPRLSPAEASTSYLMHLRNAWDAQHRDHPMAEQDVVITLPASFDELARELTIQAAKAAGLPRVQLIEEPQAAFYAWIDQNGKAWDQLIRAGQSILVCDIGGGTTDLTLIRVRSSNVEPDADSVDSFSKGSGRLQLHRVAVGQHLILGGDNLDLALARHAEKKWEEETGATQPLSPRQWQGLVAGARAIKETMLGPDPPPERQLVIAGSGSSLIGNAISIEITREDAEQVLIEGFFPSVKLDARVHEGQSGFQEMGLPYAADPAVTRHLASFLATHRCTDQKEGDSDGVDLVLFNGGVLNAPEIQRRVLSCLRTWFPGRDCQVLESHSLDRAVAAGAAYYGLVRRGLGVAITANLARSYFVQVEDDPPKAMNVIPADAEAGQAFVIDQHSMRLRVGRPAQFPMWYSSTRLSDRPGEIVPIDATEFTSLPPIQTALQDRRLKRDTSMEVVLESSLSELGTVQLACVGRPENSDRTKRWKLEFDIRKSLGTDRQAHDATGESHGILDEDLILACRALIRDVYRGAAKPNRLMKELQRELGESRDRWPPVVLRELWASLIEHVDQRKRSASHETRLMNLVGFALRPGYGVAVDDWRVAETWRLLFGRTVHGGLQNQLESLILWRRIAGGLTAGHQSQLRDQMMRLIQAAATEPTLLVEAWRLMGALERLPVNIKESVVKVAFDAWTRKKLVNAHAAVLGAVGRIGARVPAYGALNTCVSADTVTGWLGILLRNQATRASDETVAKAVERARLLAITQLCRRCHDRFRDVDAKTRETVLNELRRCDAPESWQRVVGQGGPFDTETQATIVGDSLPLGITLA
ncbi:MAG: Hsp70 family protein [Planctomycetota bacterium]